MGYQTNHVERWDAKHQPSNGQRAQISKLLERSPQWHRSAHFTVNICCRLLGYSHSVTQSPQAWLTAFAFEMLKPENCSDRKKISTLNLLSGRRSGLILLTLYLVAQHGRLQFKPVPGDLEKRNDGSPDEELRGNHHNLDHSLLRFTCYLCGHKDADHAVEISSVARATQSLTAWYLGAVGNDIAPNRVARWASVADGAAGIAPRSPGRLWKTWVQTEGSAAKHLQAKALSHFREACNTKSLASASTVLLGWGSGAYGIHSLIKIFRHLIHV